MNNKLISTSALSKKLTIPKNNLDEMLIAACFIEKSEDGYKLTKQGEENGGCWHTHQRFGTYIVWPENITIPNKIITQGKEYLNATAIANRFGLSRI